jgi:hypothetical protein
MNFKIVFERITKMQVPLFLFFGFSLYYNAFATGFLSDDFGFIENEWKLGPWGYLSGEPQGFFRPVIPLSFYVDLNLWGLNSCEYHLTNVFFHCLNSYLVSRNTFMILSAF